MGRIVWACPDCWLELEREGARLLGIGREAGVCARCFAQLRPGQRAGRFLLPDRPRAGLPPR